MYAFLLTATATGGRPWLFFAEDAVKAGEAFAAKFSCDMDEISVHGYWKADPSESVDVGSWYHLFTSQPVFAFDSTPRTGRIPA